MIKKTEHTEEVKKIEDITFELTKKQRFIFDNWKAYCQKELEIKYLEA